MGVVQDESGFAARRERAGENRERRPAEGVNIPKFAAAMNHNLNQNLKPGEQPIEVRAVMRPPWERLRAAGQN